MAIEIPSKKTENETVIQTGACRYCGQLHTFNGLIEMSEEEKITIATSMCDCDDAIEETQRLDGLNAAKEIARQELGNYAFEPALEGLIEEIAKMHLDKITLKVDNVTVTVKINSNNRISLTKTITERSTKEA